MTVEKKEKPKKKEVAVKKKPEAAEGPVVESKKIEEAKPEDIKPPEPGAEEKAVSDVKTTKPRARKSAKKEKTKAVVARGKRKEAIARATITPGKGVVRFNRVLLDSMGNKYIREIIREPLNYVPEAVNSINISISVVGGGVMGQAQAARTAISNALIQYFGDLNLKEKLIAIDRSLVIEDTRRVESKKYKGPKARARYQKSYR